MYESDIKGNVSPWVLNEGIPAREDLHDTLQAVYVWSRPENIDNSKVNLEAAVEFVKRRYEKYKLEPEPLKSYDSSFILLALHSYLKNNDDKVLEDIENYAKNYLSTYFRNGPAHNAREYSNPYWKATMLFLNLKDSGEDAQFLSSWLSKDISLPNPENEEVHKGPGYIYPHDFFSTFGTKLYAINTISPQLIPKNIEQLIPSGFITRSIDPTIFNASVLYGLCTLSNEMMALLNGKVQSAIESIFKVLESNFVEGGTKRGDYVNIRESFSTFFVYFAELLREKKEIF
ncbi:MAG: hypothetical protein QXP36_09850 [Conexivisphaerales archaeon]